MKTIILFLILGASATAFGQAFTSPENSLQFRDYAVNSEPIAHKYSTEQIPRESNTSRQSISEIRSLLDQRVAMHTTDSDVEFIAAPVNFDHAAVERDSYEFQLQLNPHARTLTITSYFDHPQHARLSLHNAQGELMAEWLRADDVSGHLEMTFDVASYPPGTYTVALNKGHLMETRELIVER